MPRYFFHVHNGEDSLDPDGVELAGPLEAVDEAARSVGSIWSERTNAVWDGVTWTMHVVDIKGGTICRLSISAVIGETAALARLSSRR